jgi:hypothetical protein
MGQLSEHLVSAETRLRVLKASPSRGVVLNCTDDVLFTLFYADDSTPFANPNDAIESAIGFYWDALERASRLFEPHEWQALAGAHSPFCDDRYSNMPARLAADGVAKALDGDQWNDEVLAVKSLLPKIAALSDTDFSAVARILSLIRASSTENPIGAVAVRLPALKSAR